MACNRIHMLDYRWLGCGLYNRGGACGDNLMFMSRHVAGNDDTLDVPVHTGSKPTQTSRHGGAYRGRASARGRYARILKRTSHITIAVAEKE